MVYTPITQTEMGFLVRLRTGLRLSLEFFGCGSTIEVPRYTVVDGSKIRSLVVAVTVDFCTCKIPRFPLVCTLFLFPLAHVVRTLLLVRGEAVAASQTAFRGC